MDESQEQLLRDLNNSIVRLNNLIAKLIAVMIEDRKPAYKLDGSKFVGSITNVIGKPLDDSQVVIQPSGWVDGDGPPLVRQTPLGDSRPDSEQSE